MSAEIEKTLKEGKGHVWPGKHKWHYVEFDRQTWDEDTMGKRFEPLGGKQAVYATYRPLLRCSCGAEIITREVAFI